MQLPYNRKSTQIDENLSKMIERELKLGHMVGGTLDNMFNSMNDQIEDEEPYKIVFLVDDSEIIWKAGFIRVEYRREDDLGEIDATITKIPIDTFCKWIIKEKHNVITHEGHNHQGVFDQWTRTYEPEDLLRDPIFDLNYHLELFLSDRGVLI